MLRNLRVATTRVDKTRSEHLVHALRIKHSLMS